MVSEGKKRGAKPKGATARTEKISLKLTVEELEFWDSEVSRAKKNFDKSVSRADVLIQALQALKAANESYLL